MLSEIPTALAALSNLRTLTKAVADSKVDAALREQAIESGFAIIDAQNAIISLQSQYQSLLEEKDRLKQSLIEMKNWETESAKYELTQIAEGLFVYALKDNYKPTTPPHWLCPDCYQNGKKSILQFTDALSTTSRRNNIFRCGQCKLEIIDHSNGAMPQ
jgi:hypothetical protein